MPGLTARPLPLFCRGVPFITQFCVDLEGEIEYSLKHPLLLVQVPFKVFDRCVRIILASRRIQRVVEQIEDLLEKPPRVSVLSAICHSAPPTMSSSVQGNTPRSEWAAPFCSDYVVEALVPRQARPKGRVPYLLSFLSAVLAGNPLSSALMVLAAFSRSSLESERSTYDSPSLSAHGGRNSISKWSLRVEDSLVRSRNSNLRLGSLNDKSSVNAKLPGIGATFDMPSSQ